MVGEVVVTVTNPNVCRFGVSRLIRTKPYNGTDGDVHYKVLVSFYRNPVKVWLDQDDIEIVHCPEMWCTPEPSVRDGVVGASGTTNGAMC